MEGEELGNLSMEELNELEKNNAKQFESFKRKTGIIPKIPACT